ncbi:acetyltransferase [Aquiflexum gelatinilyticum]|uniref:Acetyltransferase n=1 Tax=Aquiflexum gelatinilyticum TaxID=2961943 RepID=A0A9X2P435_9BACT|nr:acetyltransferase [Aquiflexum gelatinilyticum]MCR9014842.1 acetyltransferase [Aquiflexum gelatinilyticum]
MVIGGASGHALECLDILSNQPSLEFIEFYDNGIEMPLFLNKYKVIKDQICLQNHFKVDPQFILAVGNPKFRSTFYDRFIKAGGKLVNLFGFNNTVSGSAVYTGADVFNHCFIGSKVFIGKGTLVNTGAQVHHEVEVGEFCEISPRAVILGDAKIGNHTRIGANATVLPKIKIGKNVIIGAGSVITKDVPDNVTVVGVPGRIIKS